MSRTASVLDLKNDKEILDILKICGTHMASISVRLLWADTNCQSTEHELKTIRTGEGHEHHDWVITDSEEIFHISSITKVLIAVAVFIAVEVKSKESDKHNPYIKFRNIQEVPLTKLYNQNSDEPMGGLPGNPTMYNLLVHYRGLPSSNHRSLAPDGTPIMSLKEVREDIFRPLAHKITDIDVDGSWTKYSNTNYAAVVMAIEALWGNNLDSFMRETLFKPLGMNSTSIGDTRSLDPKIEGWVVDSKGEHQKILKPRYRADGAEAGALGAYSTAQDLDLFFKFLLESFHGSPILPGFDLDILGKILQMTNKETNVLRYTPLGLYTSLDSSIIGSQSINRTQFPEEKFSTYPVLPGPLGEKFHTYHMVGSAIGCNCATAFYPNPSRENYAVVVLTDTSGPVDSADHILRLILRRIASLNHSQESLLLPRQLQQGSVLDMVKEAKESSLLRWEKLMKEDANLRSWAPSDVEDISAVFKGKDFSQQLEIFREADGRAYINVSGSNEYPKSMNFELKWIDKSSVKMSVPPHVSIDILGSGDWSNLVFQVKCEGNIVKELIRETTSGGEDQFIRVNT